MRETEVLETKVTAENAVSGLATVALHHNCKDAQRPPGVGSSFHNLLSFYLRVCYLLQIPGLFVSIT